jgi:uncharacterized protein (DUF58 family)
VFGAGLLFLVGTNVQSGWVFVLSAMLFGVAVAGALLPFGMTRGLTVARRAPGETYVGDEVRVDLVVSNPTGRPRLSISIRDPFVAEANLFLPSIGARTTVTLPTRRTATRRGVAEGGPVVVSSSAPFGVAEVPRTVAAEGRTVVFPRVVPVSALALQGDPAAGPDDELPLGRGPGREFHGIREYQRGDSLRHVHWPSSARHGGLVVREFERERPARMTVVVDTAGDTRDGDSEESALDRCCSVAASVAVAALRQGHGVTVAAARDGGLFQLEDVDRFDALTFLAELGAPGGLTLAQALPSTGRAPSMLLVFPTWRSNAAAELVPPVEGLIAAGCRVVVVVVEVGASRAEPILPDGAVEELVAVLSAAGAESIRVPPGRPVAEALSMTPAGAAR